MNIVNLNIFSRVFCFVIILFSMSAGPLFSRISTEVVKVDIPVEFSNETRESFIGHWEDKEKQLIIVVKSIKADGTAKVVFLSGNQSLVKKATIERIAGAIPFLIIEMKDEERGTGLYSLTYEDGQLIGSFENMSNGDYQDLTFKLMPEEEAKAQYSQIIDS